MYRPKAGRSDERAVKSLVRRYYAAVVAGDGAAACSLLSSELIEGTVASQSSAEGGAKRACAASVSALLRQQHAHLVAEAPSTMLIRSVHVKGDLGLAVLAFRAMPEAEIIVERQRGAWRMGALVDSDMT